MVPAASGSLLTKIQKGFSELHRVGLLDDEPHVRKYVGLLARGLGSPVIFEASNGDEALALYAIVFGLILLYVVK